jgi:hypothetical protein
LTQAAAALADVLRIAPWLEPSWFLILPLTLNALALCPLVVQRARRAQRSSAPIPVSAVIAAGLSLASLAYLLLIASHAL